MRAAELAAPWRPAPPPADATLWAVLLSPSSLVRTVTQHVWLPSLGAYVAGVLSVLLLVCVLSMLCFLCNVAAMISMLSTLRECGLRRRVAARLAADPEAELDELHDDGELQYSIEDLRLDFVRLALDARTMLFYAHTLIAAERFSAHLWTELDIHLGPTGVFERTWALGVLPNAFHWLHGMRLPVAAVCLNALVAHLEPVTLSWCSQWTTRFFKPTSELLSHGFELVRLYTYLLVVLPSMSLLLFHSILPTLVTAWLASDAPAELVPTKQTLLDLVLRACMALDAAAIVYALASFQLPRHRALKCAFATAAALLPLVLALESLPSFGTAHRAAIYATVPPFAALLGTLAPVIRPRAPTPPSTAPADVAPPADAYPAHPLMGGGAEPDTEEEPASEFDDDEWVP